VQLDPSALEVKKIFCGAQTVADCGNGHSFFKGAKKEISEKIRSLASLFANAPILILPWTSG
jgi:hypothetical protein